MATSGVSRIRDYLDSNQLVAVSVYLPVSWHEAMTSVGARTKTTMQGMMSAACYAHYFEDKGLPPLVLPPLRAPGTIKSLSWYADRELYKKIKLLAVTHRSSSQQLIMSAIAENLKRTPEFKGLGIEAGFPPLVHRPEVPPIPEKPRRKTVKG